MQPKSTFSHPFRHPVVPFGTHRDKTPEHAGAP